MLDEAYKLLGVDPGDTSRTIEDTYWHRARELAKRRAGDPDAAEELERVNLAYQTVMDTRRSGPRTSRIGDPPSWRRRFALVGVALALGVAGLVAWVGFSQEIEDTATRGFEEAQYGWDETIEWLRSLDEEPTPQPASDSTTR